jgi:hypothetical protein
LTGEQNPAQSPAVFGDFTGLEASGLPAMVVNDNACDLDKRGALESIASSYIEMRSPVGAAEGCDLLAVSEWLEIKRSQPAAAPTDTPDTLELACLRWSLTITRVIWMNAAHWSSSPASWLLQWFQRGHSPLWELACQRWSSTITRVIWMNAAHLSPSPAGWLLQFPGNV